MASAKPLDFTPRAELADAETRHRMFTITVPALI